MKRLDIDKYDACEQQEEERAMCNPRRNQSGRFFNLRLSASRTVRRQICLVSQSVVFCYSSINCLVQLIINNKSTEIILESL